MTMEHVIKHESIEITLPEKSEKLPNLSPLHADEYKPGKKKMKHKVKYIRPVWGLQSIISETGRRRTS